MVRAAMDANDPRAVLARLVADRGEDYASLSRLLGRNPSYIQQFIKRGVPRKLDGDDRRTLARYFSVREDLLGGAEERPIGYVASVRPLGDDLVVVPRLAVDASAGPGTIVEQEPRRGRVAFGAGFLREIAGGSAATSMLRVSGDSMEPTLADGDEILVASRDPGEPLRDGIYVLRADGALLVKRIARNPSGGLTIRSDNPAYPAWECRSADVEVIGRVVWAGRRIG